MTEEPQQPPDIGPEPRLPTGPDEPSESESDAEPDANDMDAGTPAEEPPPA